MPEHKRYLVTGGAGFIGSNLVRYLLARGIEVVVLDNFATGKRENLDAVQEQIRLIEGDIRDPAATHEAMSGVDVVLHQAALGSVPRSVDDPMTSHDVNVNGTLCVLEAARAAGIRRVVFAASSSSYGNQMQSPKVETMPSMPISPYAANKLAGEGYMQAYAAAYGMETVSLRYFNVFGPRQDPTSAYAAVIPSFVSRLLRGESPIVYGDGEQSRDFCHIENVCEANYLAANAPAENCDGRPLNIACHRATTLNQILTQLRELLGVDVPARYEPPRPGDVRHSLADVRLAKERIGYEPRVFFEEGLAQAVDWYRQHV